MKFSISSVLLSVLLVFVSAAAAQEAPFLAPWADDVPFPNRSELAFPEGAVHSIAHDCDADPDYKFLHETAVGVCGDEIILGWYHNPVHELSGKTFQRARRTKDDGKTWSESETVMDRGNDEGLMYVGLQFFNFGDDFYVFTNQEKGTERPVNCILLKWNPESKKWDERGPVAARFLSMQQPILMADGNYIISGSYNPTPGAINGYMPVVYISQGKEIEKPWWRFLMDTEYVNMFAETAILADGPNLLGVTRLESFPFPNFYESRDYGRTWRKIENRTFPASNSKFAAGTLSNGNRYLIFSAADFKRDENGKIITDGMNRDRATLAIAIARPGEKAFSKVWKVSDKTTSTQQSSSHYPCAVEKDGKLYISYTGQHKLRNAAMTVIPIDSL